MPSSFVVGRLPGEFGRTDDWVDDVMLKGAMAVDALPSQTVIWMPVNVPLLPVGGSALELAGGRHRMSPSRVCPGSGTSGGRRSASLASWLEASTGRLILAVVTGRARDGGRTVRVGRRRGRDDAAVPVPA